MSCNCNKPKCDGKCGISPSVLQINNPGDCTLFHRVEVPASMGDSKTNPPKNGDYRNVLLYYVADGTSWFFSSDGVPQKLVNGFTNYEDAVNLPIINNVTLIGSKTGAELGLQDKLIAGDNIQIAADGKTISATDTTYTAGDNIQISDQNVISATDTTYGPATDSVIGLVKPGDGLEVSADGTMGVSDIEQYAHFFDTVAEMEAADLSAGEYVRTGGYYSVNDGGGALYKIRAITNDDVVDGNFIIEITTAEDLVAEKIVSNYDKHNVLNYGADPTGINDSASAINACIQANKGGSISFAEGVYKVQSVINLPFANADKVSINGNGAKIITTATIDSLFVGGYDRVLTTDRNDVGFVSYIKDLKIDCSGGGVTNAFYNMQGFKDWHIINCTTYRTTNGVKIGDSNNSPSDILISDCILYGNGSEYAGTGILSNATDNYVQETRIYGFRTGINIANGSAIVLDNTHVLLRWHDQTQSNFDPYPIDGDDFATYYPQTIGVYANGGLRSNNLYIDSVCTSIKVNTTSEVTLNNLKVFNSRTVEQHAIDSEVRDCKMIIDDSTFQFKNGNGNAVTGLRCIHTNATFSPSVQLGLGKIVIIGIANMTNSFDLLLAAYPNQFPNSVSMTANTWYLAGVIGNWKSGDNVNITLNVDGWSYNYRLSATAIQQYAADTNSATRYTVGTIVSGSNLLVCIKTNEAGGHVFSTSLLSGTRNNFNIAPIKNDAVQSSSRLLSAYTDSVPSLSNTVYEAIGISTVTA